MAFENLDVWKRSAGMSAEIYKELQQLAANTVILAQARLNRLERFEHAFYAWPVGWRGRIKSAGSGFKRAMYARPKGRNTGRIS